LRRSPETTTWARCADSSSTALVAASGRWNASSSTIHNADVARVFNRLADLLEIDGANPFRVRAYRDAARIVGDLPQEVSALVAAGKDLSELHGIGRDLAGKIGEIVQTGHLALLEETERRVPEGLLEILSLGPLGPKRVKTLYDQLGIKGLADLEAAARAGRIHDLRGFSARMEERLLDALAHHVTVEPRLLLASVEGVAQDLVQHLGRGKAVGEVVVAGSYRRRRENVGDLDILVTAAPDSDVMDRFVGFEEVAEVLGHGRTRSTVRLRSGLQVDVRVVPGESYGAALHYFTGSKAHNIRVRGMGVERGLKINEYGVFKGDARIAGRTEDEVYVQVGLPYIEPELRENRGEIEAALEGRLPKLITLADIKGDLHAHTTETDGRATLEEMAAGARGKGYQYLAITDHSQRVAMARGLDTKRLRQQIKAIDRLNERLDGIVILKGIEVDILEDGSLDLPDAILKELDLCVCSIHYGLNLPSEKQTERLLPAMDNRYCNIIGHPTGRLLNKRGPFDVDLERIMRAALERGCFLELNAQPDRLDLNDAHCQMANELGLKVAISTDAHSVANLDLMRFGIDQARRGWLEPKDVLNTRPWPQLKKLLRRT
jgi:DNA polymerase (family 10)